MTERNMFKKTARHLCGSILTAAMCAGLLLSGCASGQTQNQNPPQAPAGGSGSTAAAASTADASTTDASTAEAAGTESTEAVSSAMTSSQSAAAATTSAEYADPDWKGDEEIAFSAEGKGLVIVLDPGHAAQVPGYSEPIGPGAAETKEADTVGTYGSASGQNEYELTMDVSRKLRAELEERGYEVKLTHSDTFNAISCSERAAVANDNHADAFIRIHANGSEDTTVHGAMTICITKDNPYHPELYSASARLSRILLDTYCEQTGARKEEVRETDDMTGNNWAEMPTTLIELGYMTNPDEDLEMNQDSYQKTMVKAIADALDKWFARMPAEELSMHPSLTQEAADSVDSSSTAEQAETADSSSTAEQAETADTSSTADQAETAETSSTADQAETADTSSTADQTETGDSSSAAGQEQTTE